MAVPGVEVTGGPVPGSDRILTDDALAFVADLQRRFGPLREDLLERRHERDSAIRAGTRTLDFLPETAEVRTAEWSVVRVLPPMPCRAMITGNVSVGSSS